MKKKLNRKGFTLVELIVVIAILAILAGVAIPVYSNYITKANEAADYANLDAIKTAVAFIITEDGVQKNPPVAPEISKIIVNGETGSVTVTSKVGATSTTGDVVVTEYFPGEIEFKSDHTTATWENGAWKFE